jgi:predicted nucleic acid-binding protein
LVRSVHRKDPTSRTARQALAKLWSGGDGVFVAFQNAAEFWVVCTRPVTTNGLGFTPRQVQRYVSRFEPLFGVLFETSETYSEWKRLVVASGVSGVAAHDTRLVAIMLTYGVDNILTFNVSDFKRFSGITVVHPTDILNT